MAAGYEPLSPAPFALGRAAKTPTVRLVLDVHPLRRVLDEVHNAQIQRDGQAPGRGGVASRAGLYPAYPGVGQPRPPTKLFLAQAAHLSPRPQLR